MYSRALLEQCRCHRSAILKGLFLREKNKSTPGEAVQNWTNCDGQGQCQTTAGQEILRGPKFARRRGKLTAWLKMVSIDGPIVAQHADAGYHVGVSEGRIY
jgi:hypothetical protein